MNNTAKAQFILDALYAYDNQEEMRFRCSEEYRTKVLEAVNNIQVNWKLASTTDLNNEELDNMAKLIFVEDVLNDKY